jgi:glutathione S-transferase
LQLIIGNKRYSSWSLRPWLVMTHFGLPFEEILILLDTPTTSSEIRRYSPSGRVPCLTDGAITVWETLAIIEYLAERFPDRAVWPRDQAARAMARAISSEMHAGFSALRAACPMNLRRSFDYRDRGPGASADGARITTLWRDARRQFGKDGPYLFGAFSAADAMYAPVVLRLTGYAWPLDADIAEYVASIHELPAMQAWKAAAATETWIVPSDEIDE